MSEFDSKVYERYLAEVGREISSLRVILEGVEAKSKERVWLSHKTSGDFDDRKLIDGITGEKNVYKKRGEQDPQPGSLQEKPKRIRFVLVKFPRIFCQFSDVFEQDVSGSMYRFNGQDRRLER